MKILEKIKNEPIIFMFRKMWNFSQGNRKKVVLYLILTAFASLTTLLPPIIFGKFINEIQKNNISSENIDFLIIILISFFATSILFWIFHGTSRILERENAFEVKKKYTLFLENIVINKNLNWHSNRESGNLIDKINNSTNSLFSFSEDSYVAVQNFIGTLGAIIAISFFNIYMALGIIIFLFLPFYIMNKFDKKLVRQYKKLNEYNNKISGKIFDIISNISSVIILKISPLMIKDIEKVVEKPRKLFKKNIRINEWKWFTITMIVESFIVLPLIIYIFYHYKNNLFVEVGTLTTLYMYLKSISSVFFSAGGYYSHIIRQKVNIENVKEIEDFENKKKYFEEFKKINWEKLKIKNLDFKYESVSENILHLNSVNLEIKKGEKIAFIGKSGSGKTTFLKVIHGLYENAKGEISFENKVEKEKINFRDFDLKTMLVPQEPELFSSSIRENVTFGLDYSDDEIKKVLKLSGFLEVLENLPKGLDSVINEKGVNLSGGQKQRLALARALLFSTEKEIILLDESTSSVDPESEVKIYKNIFEEFSGKTFLASIHKMNLLKYFDRIIIFENGKIIERGTFEELYEKSEDFKKQWDEYVKEK